jgi:lipoprotein-anchoring transpeptidase ErfK/SrfK
MQRQVLFPILASFASAAFFAPAVFAPAVFAPVLAGPLALAPENHAPAVPVQQVAAEQQNLGGGFLEFIFRAPGGQPSQPRYERAPLVMPPQREAPPVFFRGQPAEPVTYGDEAVEPDDRPAARPSRAAMNPRFQRQEVQYDGKEKPGTVIINTRERLLYLVKDDGKALRYGIGVGRPGFTWAGVHHVSSKKEWPDWRPPEEMLKRQPHLPRYMPGGPDNPLGARAMYLGSTLYRIHGSNEPWTIGQAVSSGCIRMRNEDVVHLYNQIKVGTRVVVI